MQKGYCTVKRAEKPNEFFVFGRTASKLISVALYPDLEVLIEGLVAYRHGHEVD